LYLFKIITEWCSIITTLLAVEQGWMHRSDPTQNHFQTSSWHHIMLWMYGCTYASFDMLKLFQVMDVHVCYLIIIYYKLALPLPPKKGSSAWKRNHFALIKVCCFRHGSVVKVIAHPCFIVGPIYFTFAIHFLCGVFNLHTTGISCLIQTLVSQIFITTEHVNFYKYYVSGHYPSSCPCLTTPSWLFFKTQRFGDWILSLSSGKMYSVRPSR
jgi:hypothetical protein